jgi:hypothetical protein
VCFIGSSLFSAGEALPNAGARLPNDCDNRTKSSSPFLSARSSRSASTVSAFSPSRLSPIEEEAGASFFDDEAVAFYSDGVPFFINAVSDRLSTKECDPRILRIAFCISDLLRDSSSRRVTILNVQSLDELTCQLRLRAGELRGRDLEEAIVDYPSFIFRFKDRIYHRFEDLLALTHEAPEGMAIVVRIHIVK